MINHLTFLKVCLEIKVFFFFFYFQVLTNQLPVIVEGIAFSIQKLKCKSISNLRSEERRVGKEC